MYQVIIVIQVLVGLGIIGLVLMQQGKGADAGAAFGSGSSGSVFGAQGSASFLSRATAILAVIFFASSLGLAILSGYVEESTDIMDVDEEVFADVPLVDSESVPQDNDDLPGGSIPDEMPNIDVSQPANSSDIPGQETVQEVVDDTTQLIEQVQQPAENQAETQVQIPE